MIGLAQVELMRQRSARLDHLSNHAAVIKDTRPPRTRRRPGRHG